MTKEEKLYHFILDTSLEDIPILELIEKLKVCIADIADDFHIGSVGASFSAGISPFNYDSLNYDSYFYNCDEINPDDKIIKEYVTGEKGVIVFTVNGRKDYEWSENDQLSIEAFINVLIVILSRSRMRSLLDKVTFADLETGIPNMAAMRRFASQLEDRGTLTDYAVLFVNIKNFRIFNKREGTKAADEMLRIYSHTLDQMVEADEMAARPSGDSVVMLIRKEHVVNSLKSIDAIHIPLTKNGKTFEIHLDCWVGVYFIQTGVAFADALSYSSIAMTNAKNGRKNQLVSVFDDAMMNDFERHNNILAMFNIGLKAGEFEVYYQPKANVGKQIVGAEGLVRWNRRGKVISPLEFIPALEEDGSIIELDFFVFERVCKDLREWLDKGLEPVRVSTNFSKDHFRGDGTVERILSIMRKYNIAGGYIQVEITEMSRFDDWKKIIKFIKDLHKHGITVAIDDFGVGYSSLNLLKDYEADIVKIDKSLLNDIEDNPKAKILLEYTIKLSQDIGMDVVVEGVETRNQLGYVANVGCNMVQGFYFDKPLTKEVFESRLSNKTYKKG